MRRLTLLLAMLTFLAVGACSNSGALTGPAESGAERAGLAGQTSKTGQEPTSNNAPGRLSLSGQEPTSNN